MNRWINRLIAAVFVGWLIAAVPTSVWACPMCNQAIQEDKSLPLAYQASILFMLGMPFTVLGGLGGMIWYKFRQHALAQANFTITQRHALAGGTATFPPESRA